MAEIQQYGNDTTSSSFDDFVLAFKNNIMRNLNVADIVKIIQKLDNNTYKVQSITNLAAKYDCISLSNLAFNENDVALIVFANADFRTNLIRLQNSQEISSTNVKTLHSNAYGILIGLIYNGGQQ